MRDESNRSNASAAKTSEILPVTENLYTDLTLEELEERLELQAMLDGDLGAESCYVEPGCTCFGEATTTVTMTTITVTTRPV